MNRVARPSSRLITLISLVLAAGLGYAVFQGLYALIPAAGDPVTLLAGDRPMPAPTCAAAEVALVEEAFSEVYLPTPIGPLPCPRTSSAPYDVKRAVRSGLESFTTGDSREGLRRMTAAGETHWLPALAMATALAREGETSQALLVADRYLTRESTQRVIRDIVNASRRDEPVRNVGSEQIRALLHLLHLKATLQLESGQRDELKFWTSVKHPIACAEQLTLKGEIGEIQAMPTWSELVLAAPGCRAGDDSLTTYDLYNNLLVAYLLSPDYTYPNGRSNEFKKRPYETYGPNPESNPLLTVLRHTEETLMDEREHWLWALSNAEGIVNWSSLPPADARLSYTLATLTHSALAVAPAEATAPLRRLRQVLTRSAAAHRDLLPPAQVASFDRGISRLQLLTAIDEGTPPELEPATGQAFDGPQNATAAAVRRALELRGTPAQLAAALRSEEELRSLRGTLGEGAESWLAAARRDTAAEIARRTLAAGENVDAEARFAAAGAARTLLDGGSIPPPLSQLESSLGWRGWLLSDAGRWTAVILSGLLALALAWLFLGAGRWLELQNNRRRELVTSFFRRELIAQRGRGR